MIHSVEQSDELVNSVMIEFPCDCCQTLYRGLIRHEARHVLFNTWSWSRVPLLISIQGVPKKTKTIEITYC